MYNFTNCKPVNSGRYGTVYQCIKSGKDEFVAVKKICLNRHDIIRRDYKKMVIREFENWSKLRGQPFILELKEFIFDIEKDEAIFVSEYCDRGSLADNVKILYNDKTLQRTAMKDILMGIYRCHVNDIAHCDIKPANILWSNNNIWKLADFGNSQFTISAYDGLFTKVGTPVFLAPELLMNPPNHNYGKNVDVWSFGVLAFFLFHRGKYPFPIDDRKQLMQSILDCNIDWSDSSHLSDDEKDFISKCLHYDKKTRLSSEEILRHPFLRK